MAIALTYEDPIEGFTGWLSYNGDSHRLAAGGCRVQAGLSAETLDALSARMTLKERVLGVNVDGAKCGIDYSPSSPGKAEALQRFLSFLRGELAGRLSMGPDMGTQWGELERLAALEGIPSVKYAIRGAQRLDENDFFQRLRLLDARVGALTLGQRRAGHALAQAVMAVARTVAGGRRLACAVQGLGTLGRAAAYSLVEQNVAIVAVADEHGCVANARGLDIERVLHARGYTPVTQIGGERRPGAALFEVPCDVLVLAATEDAMTAEQADSVAAPAVVVGANCGLKPEIELRLNERGVLVIPDFIGGIGGSASMEALFGCNRPPSAAGVLDRVEVLMRALIDELIDAARREAAAVRDVALAIAAARPVAPGDRPYGCCPYLAPMSV